MAELEWNALSPALKSYIKARQHLDFALLLQISAVFSTTEQPAAFQHMTQPSAQPFDGPNGSSELLEPHRKTFNTFKTTRNQNAAKPKKQKRP